MNTEKRPSALFFELVQVALGARDALSGVPSVDEWTTMYGIARKQALLGICSYGIQQLAEHHPEQIVHLSPTLKLQWTGMAVMIQERNRLMNKRCVELQNKLAQDGFRTYIMKGQGNTILYGDGLNLLRQPGDIDIFLEGGAKRVIKYVDATFPTREVSELEIHYDCFPDAVVEIHYLPFIMRDPFKNIRLLRFFRSENERCFGNVMELPGGAGKVAVPTPTFNIVHQLVHVKHHLFTGGIGLRQLMDYGFVLRDAKAKSVDTAYARETVRALGMERFACSLMWVLRTVFALEADVLLWEQDEKYGRRLLKEILRSGNFGQMSEHKIPKGLLGRFLHVNAEAFRLSCFDASAWFWTPLWRLWHFGWRKLKGYK